MSVESVGLVVPVFTDAGRREILDTCCIQADSTPDSDKTEYTEFA